MSLYEVFKLHTLREKIANHKLESVATYKDIIFVGTGEGTILVWQAVRTTVQSFEMTTVHIQRMKHKHPIMQMVPVPDLKMLLVLSGGVVTQHHMDTNVLLDKSPSDRKLPEFNVIKAMKDGIAFHVKKHRGKVLFASIQRKKVLVGEFTANKDFVLKNQLGLPEGIRTVNWSGNDLILGFKNEYVLMEVTGSNNQAQPIGPTGKSETPIVCNLDPTTDILLGIDTTGIRAKQDGEPVDRSSKGISWASVPSCVMYNHPYVLSIHDGNSIEVRNPFLSGAQSLCQSIAIKYVDQVSFRGYVDYDDPLPTSPDSVPSAVMRRDVVVAITSSNSIYLLEMVPIREQVFSIAATKNFQGALNLASICPNEVPATTLNDVNVQYALFHFTQKAFEKAMKKFEEAHTDPRFLISLFPGFLPEYVAKSWKPTTRSRFVMDKQELAQSIEDALDALVGFLIPRRRPPHEEIMKPPEDDTGMTLSSIDTAILRSFVMLRREAELLSFVQSLNWCVVDDCERFLTEHQQWIALILLWKNKGKHVKSLSLLKSIGHCGRPETIDGSPLPPLMNQVVVDVVNAAVMKFNFGATMPTQKSIEQRVRDFTPEENRTMTCKQAVAMIATVYYIRMLDTTEHRDLIVQYAAWIVAHVEPKFALTVYTQGQGKHEPSDVLRYIKAVDEPRTIPATKSISYYLEYVLGPTCNDLQLSDLHNERVRTLIALVLTERSAADVKRTPSQDKLLDFLERSKYYDTTRAIQWLQAEPAAPTFFQERAVVYSRREEHSAAIAMFLNERSSVAEAEAYATKVSETNGDAFKILLQHLLKPTAQGKVRIEAALDVINRCEGVDAISALPMLPDDVPLSTISKFVQTSLRASQIKARSSEVQANILKTRHRQSQLANVKTKLRHVTVDSGTLCAVPDCKKKIRTETVFARYPSGVVVHQACLDSEYICPITQRDFRKGLESIL